MIFIELNFLFCRSLFLKLITDYSRFLGLSTFCSRARHLKRSLHRVLLQVDTCYRQHPHLRPPAGAKRWGLKEGPPCKGCGSTWHTLDQCWKLHPHLKPQPKKAAKPPPKRD